MSREKIKITHEVEQIEDPNDTEKVFYRIKLSSKPSRDFLAGIYDFWNNHALNRNRNHKELLSDYAGNLLLHTYLTEDVGEDVAVLQAAVISASSRNY
jgi:hypothetical protein